MSVRTVPIGELVDKVATWNPASSADAEFYYIDLSAIDQDRKLIAEYKRIFTKEAPSRARQIVRKGDILVSTVRPNLNGVAPVLEEHDGMTASTGFCVLRPNERRLDGGYLFHWVRSASFVRDMVQQATGASYPAISDRIVKSSEIPLPPLDEQKRIAAILDKADALRRKRRQALALLDSLTQSIFLEMFGDPVSNPRGWREEMLGEALAEIDSGWSPICLDRAATSEEWGVLKLSAVTSGYFIEIENKALPKELKPRPEIGVRRGDVLFTRKNTRALVAACALVWDIRSRLMISDLIFRLVIRDRRVLLPIYLWSCLSNPGIRSKVQLLAGGAAGSMPNISKEKLRKFSIPIPEFKSQELFEQRAFHVFRKQQEISTQSLQLESLFASLQHRAFSGQL